MGLIKSWSFSTLGAYEECPAKLKFKKIDKLQEPSSPALEYGTQIHKLCEDYLRGVKRTVPKEAAKITDILKDLKKRKALPEAEFTFRQDWSPTEWKDWSGAWVRVKADAVIPPVVDSETPTVEIIDFKTGGAKKLEAGDFGSYFMQLELYALSGLLTYPTAERSDTSLIFVDHGRRIESPEVYVQKDVPKLKKKWEMRVKKMMADTVFKPKPGNACRWCHFRKSNAGPCPH
jgi:RecB family exonuclease